MINIIDVTNYLENKLNTAIANDTSAVLDNGREIYRVKIWLDAGEYKSFDYIKQGKKYGDKDWLSPIPTNNIVHYINGILSVTESNVEGADTSILTFSTTLELLIPLRNLDEETTQMELVASIRNIIDNALSINEFNAFEGFNLGINYSLAGTGQRKLNNLVGDCVSLYVYIVFSLVENGVNSTEIIITIDGVNVDSQRKGYSRVATQEADVSNKSQDGSAGVVTSNTVFTLNFDKPVQKTAIDDIFRRYLLNGSNEIYTVTIKEPAVNGYIETTKQMVISEVTRNTDTTLNASETITMVEAL